MNRDTFNTEFLALLKAYSFNQNQQDPAAVEVYWQMLKAIPDDKFRAAIRKCLAECKFFPTIAEIGAAALPPITTLSDHRVQTRNGLDRIPITLSWQDQLSGLEALTHAETRSIDSPAKN